MRSDNNSSSAGRYTGVIVIGRNEGERLRRAFASLPLAEVAVLYVDSGSTDGSVELAHSLGIETHCLDPSRPFSAARARVEGAMRLMSNNPYMEFVHFLDGDCTLKKSWLTNAIQFLELNKDVGIVCGKLEEEAPERSIYNRLSAIKWKAVQIGEINSCGGIFLIRRSVYEAVEGFNPLLMTGEEAELCVRVREKGYKVFRLNEYMARHDTDLVNFEDWWKRAVWGGYGDALEYEILSGNVSSARRRETRSVFIWAVIMPLLAMFGLFGFVWVHELVFLTFFALLGYFLLTLKISINRVKTGDSIRDAALYSCLNVIRKIPYAIGFFSYKISHRSINKRPDPHAGRK